METEIATSAIIPRKFVEVVKGVGKADKQDHRYANAQMLGTYTSLMHSNSRLDI